MENINQKLYNKKRKVLINHSSSVSKQTNIYTKLVSSSSTNSNKNKIENELATKWINLKIECKFLKLLVKTKN